MPVDVVKGCCKGFPSGPAVLMEVSDISLLQFRGTSVPPPYLSRADPLSREGFLSDFWCFLVPPPYFSKAGFF
jgi:hypothetical protein